MRVRAARMSSLETGSTRRIARAAKVHAHAGPFANGLGVYVRPRAEIFHRQPEGLEQRDVGVTGAPLRATDEQLANFAEDVIGADVSGLERGDDVAGFLERGLT